jgi:hypothetical protein
MFRAMAARNAKELEFCSFCPTRFVSFDRRQTLKFVGIFESKGFVSSLHSLGQKKCAGSGIRCKIPTVSKNIYYLVVTRLSLLYANGDAVELGSL